MNFKEEYRNYNEAIRPDRALVEEMKEAAREWKEDRRKNLLRVTRDLMAAAAACVFIFVGIPVIAANVDPVYAVMYRVLPETAQLFRLVQRSDEQLGIRMEVVSAYVHENELQAYITLQDLEGDRIDETTDLYDSYSICLPFPGSGTCQYVDFDSETGKASFLVTLWNWSKEGAGPQDITGKKITFALREFLSCKEEYLNLEIPVSWSEVQEEPEVTTFRLRGGSVPNVVKGDSGNPVPSGRMLKPGEPDERLSVEGIELTGMGYIDGLLHIQTMAPRLLETDNHCELYLVDKDGNRRHCDYSLNAFGNTEETKDTDYQDSIFDITPEELENYTLHGDFTITGVHVKGNWTVTFPVGEE